MCGDRIIPLLLFVAVAFGCRQQTGKRFTRIDAAGAGIGFVNRLQESADANVVNYAYFYNGGGVSAGDFNRDGLPDLFFTGNMVRSRLFLNQGGFSFRDITDASGIGKEQGWCTGSTVADVDGDGWPDIYVCRSADADPVRRRNLLYINNHDGTFREEAVKRGVADEGYSTQAAFFDYDRDGDLDLIVVNHSLQEYATDGNYEKAALRNKEQSAFSNKLYRNDGGHFTDVSVLAGIRSNVLTFSLGLVVSDLNRDGWPDLYISNDFNEPDYYYVNNRDGSFTERSRDAFELLSLYSMGADAADINNDGLPDLVTLDMLPEGNFAQKMHSGAENFDKFRSLFSDGFYYQYSRNMLQKNNGDGTFSEIGQFAGVAKTDWSWSPLLADFDNDGRTDLFISNGYEKDNSNLDYIRYRMDKMLRANGAGFDAAGVSDLIRQMPQVKLSHYMYRSEGEDRFRNVAEDWGLDEPAVGTGAAYADLDNDGDLDLIVSNINDAPSLYRNNGAQEKANAHFLRLQLRGRDANTFAVGAAVSVFAAGRLFYQENFPVRGFQSSMDPALHFGLGTATNADSIIIRWPDGYQERFGLFAADLDSVVSEGSGRPRTEPGEDSRPLFVTAPGPAYRHHNPDRNDLDRQPLLPQYLSRQGPALAAADLNGDHLQDIYTGADAALPGTVLLQSKSGTFLPAKNPVFASDPATGPALFLDIDADGDTDLFVGAGMAGDKTRPEKDRLYLNDGYGHFSLSRASLPELNYPKSCIAAADINGDGYPDLFVAGAATPETYPYGAPSVILLNDRHGGFSDMTASVAPALSGFGITTTALFADCNGDGQPDLVAAGEWMPVHILLNKGGRLTEDTAGRMPLAGSGWWHSLAAADFDGDGDIDLVAGNQGMNTSYSVSDSTPLVMLAGDFDTNGSPDFIIGESREGGRYPLYARDDLAAHLPGIKKDFSDYSGYAAITLDSLMQKEHWTAAKKWTAITMQTVYFENRGNRGFVCKALPPEANWSPVYAIQVADLNGDGAPDLLMAGNNAWNRIRFGRDRSSRGQVFLNDGKAGFRYLNQTKSGLHLRGDVRSLLLVPGAGGPRLFAGINDDSLGAYRMPLYR